MLPEASHYEEFTGHSPSPATGPFRVRDYWNLPGGEPVELFKGEAATYRFSY